MDDSASLKLIYKAFLNGAVICTDTRKITEGCIFFALKGANFDGNNFALEAIRSGAAYAVADNPGLLHERIVQANDVLLFLQDLARFHRRHLNIPVIGITGSNGKTTTKELISRVLSKKYSTFSTSGNLNNHIGVPLSILSVTNKHECAIIEMGANHRGEIKLLCSVALPTHVLITNVGKAHLEGFGGFEGVKLGKGEMYDFAKANHSLVFINAGNEHLLNMLGNHNEKFSYCLDCPADVEGIPAGDGTYAALKWKTHSGSWHEVQSHITGNYNNENILAAIAAGIKFEVTPDDINTAIASYFPDNQRSQMTKIGSNNVLLDAYNANPTSMEAALTNFSKNYHGATAVFLGEMLELGESSAEEHKKITEQIKACNFTEVVLVGNRFAPFSLPEWHQFATSDEARDYIRTRQFSGYTILVKGSRGSRMEVAVSGLKD
ncbi:MAG TPA: UDP-N-acetylmuramoyl-tripeptide--D-alanyl-D-alanine ligase [Bacteroidia bacterium]|nr:UDP-N-acetylmuramoyl-tripeptide--D-alanyl-D-alanine ligase [Bacteroidia bacterium]